MKLIDKSNNHIVDEYAFLLDCNIKVNESILDENNILCSFNSSYQIENSEGIIVSLY